MHFRWSEIGKRGWAPLYNWNSESSSGLSPKKKNQFVHVMPQGQQKYMDNIQETDRPQSHEKLEHEVAELKLLYLYYLNVKKKKRKENVYFEYKILKK